jgi:hypothetical protein
MAIDKKKLSELSPEERIKKLKELQEEKKKDSSEINKLLKSSEKQLQAQRLADEISPRQREVDISQLFEIVAGGQLEITVANESEGPIGEGTGTYQAFTQLYSDYSQLKEFYDIASGGSGLTREQLNAIGQIGERLNTAEKYMTEGERISHILDPSKTILYKLKKETGLDTEARW